MAAKQPTRNDALFWRALYDIATDTETKARCMGNAIYAAALAHGMNHNDAAKEGHSAYDQHKHG